MTVFRAATLRTFFFAFQAGAKELKNVFLQVISCLTNSLLSGFLSILFILRLIWSFVLTLWTFRVLLPSVCSALRRRFRTPADD